MLLYIDPFLPELAFCCGWLCAMGVCMIIDALRKDTYPFAIANRGQMQTIYKKLTETVKQNHS